MSETTTTEITWTILLASKPTDALIGRETSSKQSPTGNVRITRVGKPEWFTSEAIEDFGGCLPRGATRGAYRVTLYGVPA